jgi:predicted nucleic acid-binding protein
MSSTTGAWTVDANVILRYLVQEDAGLSAQATAIMESLERGESALVCDPVTLAEVVWVLSSYYHQPNDEISAALLAIVGARGLLMSNKPRYLRALELLAGEAKHFGDACACAAALEASEGRLLSFDRGLSSVSGVHRAERLPDGSPA